MNEFHPWKETPWKTSSLRWMTAFFEQIPQALGPDGDPLADFDEALWREEFGEIGAEEEEEWIQSGGYLEYRGTYSTNIDQSAPGTDVDLRVKPNETEVSDWFNTFSVGYEHQFEIIPDVMKGAVRYDFAHFNYADEPRENSTQHLFELATIQRVTEKLEWEIYGGFGIESREPGAQYRREDFLQWHLGTEFRQEVGDDKFLSAGYEFRHRDYETRRGLNLLPSEMTPFYDWSEHRFWSAYSHQLTEKLLFDASLNFSKRDYESVTLNEFGIPMDSQAIPLAERDSEYRKYDLWEPLVALTATPTEHTELSTYYRFKSLRSTGSYYDYQESSVGLLLRQDLCPERVPGLVLISQLEYANKNYDAQYARSRLPGTQQVRDDERITLYLAIERTVEEKLTTGIDFYYVDNDSNDHWSKYQDERYGAYVRYDF